MDAPISILFYLKRAKVNAQGLVPIFQRITINRQRLDNSIGKFKNPEKWHSEMYKMRGNSKEARSINTHLDILKIKIIDAQMELIHKNIPLTHEIFKNKLLGTEERQRILIPIFQDHNNKIKELVGKEYALKHWSATLHH